MAGDSDPSIGHKVVVCTFAAGAVNIIAAGERLRRQAAALDCVDRAVLYTDADLRSDVDFWGSHGDFVERNRRGYGYWLWKPYLVLKTLRSLGAGDVLIYLDAGCEVDRRGEGELEGMIRRVRETGEPYATFTGHTEHRWTKEDLFIHVGAGPNIRNSKQMQAGAIIIRRDAETVAWVERWFELCTAESYHFLDDTPSALENHPDFVEHRHDQSCYNMAVKTARVAVQRISLSAQGDSFCPIVYARNKSGASKLPQ